MRVERGPAENGSERWLQAAVARRPDLLTWPGAPAIDWRSPLAEDAAPGGDGRGFAEYRDAAFLERVGLGAHAAALAEFWPRRGPSWDGLGAIPGGVALVEAKSHLGEFGAAPMQAGEASRARIEAALAATKAALGADPAADWTGSHYQYANRLAHLHWLTARGVEAHLLYVAFLDDDEMRGPSDPEDWREAFAAAERALGLAPDHPLAHRVHHAFPRVGDLA